MTDPADHDPDVWGAAAKRHLERAPLGWLDTPWVLRRRVFPLVFGRDVDGWWTQDAMGLLGVPTGGEWLDIGCGGGGNEIDMARHGLFAHMTAYDPSPGAISVAREQANAAAVTTIDFRVAAVDEIELRAESCDVAHINMALHHVVELEHVLFQINQALRPGGLFIANEFIGPSQFQFSRDRMAAVESSLLALPERLRWNPFAQEVKRTQPRYTRRWWNESDPSEAVRADEIERIVALNFPAYRRIDYGGNLLNLALENIAQNFDPDDEEDAAHISALFLAEDALLATEPSDFAYLVCPKGTPDAVEHGRQLAIRMHHRFERKLDPIDNADLAEITRLGNIELEDGSGSQRRLIGSSITFAKKALRRGLRFHLAPVVDRQRAVNQAMVELLHRLNETQAREIAELRSEVAALRRDIPD